MKGLRDKKYALNVLCYSLTSLRALRNHCERCVFVFRTMNGILCVKSKKENISVDAHSWDSVSRIVPRQNWTMQNQGKS